MADEDSMELTEAEAKLVNDVRSRGLAADSVLTRAARDYDRERGETGGGDGADGIPADAPITKAQLDAQFQERDQAQEQRRRQASATQELTDAVKQVIHDHPTVSQASDRKQQAIVQRAFNIAREDPSLASMSPAEIEALVVKKAEIAIEEEVEDARRLGGVNEGELKSRLDARKNAGEGAGAGRSANSGSRDSAADEFSIEGVEYGPGVEVEYPTEAQLYADTAKAADRFLKKARAGSSA